MSYKKLALFMALCSVFATAPTLASEGWKPTTQIEYVAPAGAGGAADTYARAMGKIFEKHKLLNGQPFIVTNRPSTNGAIALQPLEQNPDNPHYLTLLHSGMTIANLTGQLKSQVSGFTPAGYYLKEAMTLAVPVDSKYKTANDLIDALKRNPESLNFGYAGHHLLMSMAAPLQAAGVDLTRLTIAPYKSSAEALSALMGGHIDVAPASSTNVVGLLEAGKIRLLAIQVDERLGGVFANVPTWKEQGVETSYSSQYGLLLPPNVPKEAVTYWENALKVLSEDPEWKDLLARNGTTSIYMNSKQAQAYQQEEAKRLKPLVDKLGIGGL